MTDDLTLEQRVERGHRAERAMSEFLEPAFDQVRAEYAARLAVICATEPWAANKVSALANASRIVEEVQAQIMALIMNGEEAHIRKSRAERIEELSPAKKRLLNIGGFG